MSTEITRSSSSTSSSCSSYAAQDQHAVARDAQGSVSQTADSNDPPAVKTAAAGSVRACDGNLVPADTVDRSAPAATTACRLEAPQVTGETRCDEALLANTLESIAIMHQQIVDRPAGSLTAGDLVATMVTVESALVPTDEAAAKEMAETMNATALDREAAARAADIPAQVDLEALAAEHGYHGESADPQTGGRHGRGQDYTSGTDNPGTSESERNRFLGDGKKEVGDGGNEPSNSLRSASGDIEVQANVIQGRYADTLQGGRVNDAAGSGFHDPGNYTGGGRGHDSEDDYSTDNYSILESCVWLAGAIGTPGGAFYDPAAKAGAALLTGCYVGDQIRQGAEHFPAKEAARMKAEGGQRTYHGWGSVENKDPNPTDDGTTGGGRVFVAPFGNVEGNLRHQVKTGGAAGSPDDGRGTDKAGGAAVYNRMAGKAIAEHTGGRVDAEKEKPGGKISYEEALAAAHYTDPTRT